MTESEAKTKWCPMVRFYVADHDHYDNKPQNDGFGKADKNSGFCIGSACMMWRWNEPQNINFKGDPPYSMVGEDMNGYCGLSGKL